MRLIDADAIKALVHEICSNEWNHKTAPASWADAYEDFDKDINAAHTIDAIPVEWLCNKMREEENYGNILKAEYLKELIWEFHQDDEQEVRI